MKPPPLQVLYLDPAPPAFRELLRQKAGEGLSLSFLEDPNPKTDIFAGKDCFLVAAARIDAAMIAAPSRLRLIQKTGVGVDNIDLHAAQLRGIPVCNTPGGNATSVAELTLLHMLALLRRLPLLNERCHRGEWPMWEYRLHSHELQGKVHGIVGYGQIGRRVGELSQAFGATVKFHDPAVPASVPLAELLRDADIVSLHVPLSPTTRRLIGRKELALLKPTAFLVNMARGGVVDEGALAQALTTNRLAGAAADTLEDEPRIASNPLLRLANFHCTPHVGAGTCETLEAVLTTAFDNIRRIRDGLPLCHHVAGPSTISR